MKNTTRITAALLVGGVTALAAPTAAQAHVSASSTSTAAGSYAIVAFSVPHGCEDSATQVVTIDLPETILSVTPTVNPLWSVAKVTAALDEPIESAPGTDPVAERIGQVVYTSTAGGLPDGFRDTFELALQLPTGEAGDVIEFPVTQTCTEGSVIWEGDDVPSVTLTAATADDHAHGEMVDLAKSSEGQSVELAPASTTDQGVDPVARIIGVGGIIAGIIGVSAAVFTRRALNATA